MCDKEKAKQMLRTESLARGAAMEKREQQARARAERGHGVLGLNLTDTAAHVFSPELPAPQAPAAPLPQPALAAAMAETSGQIWATAE